MPVTVERIEPRIYLSIYSGNATNDEILEVIYKRKMLADEYHESSYISVADLTAITSLPLDVTTVRSMGGSDPRNIRYLVVGASLQIRVLLESFGANTSANLEFFKTVEEALTRARMLLQERNR
jgi:hypothetical protein